MPIAHGFYAGSFNPFTRGHASIVSAALSFASRITIGIGIHPNKPYNFVEERVAAIAKIYADDPRVDVVAYQGLTVDYAKKAGATFLLRGVRSVSDFEAERDMAELNRRLGGLETVLLVADPALGCISSSAVRELASHGIDVSQFLPEK